MKFMNSSIDALEEMDFKYLSQKFIGDLIELLYSYEYIDSLRKFFHEKLPDRWEFFSSLKDECISEKDYLCAFDVWIIFKLNTIGDYHNLYLKTDVSKLADVLKVY